MSVIIILLPGAPKPNEDAVEADEKLNRKIMEFMTGCYCYKCFVCNKI